MKHFLTVTTLALTLFTGSIALPLQSAAAMEPMAPVQQQNFTCGAGAGGVTRVSTADIAGKCCSPNSHCVEYLSTTRMDHDSKANRT